MTIQNLLLFLEKVLSWPVAIVVLVLLFRKPLLGLLNRLSTLKVGKELFSIDAPPIIQSDKPIETSLENKASLIEKAKYGEYPIVQRREELIRQDLQKLQLDSQPQEAVNVLVRHLALSQLLLFAEQIYRNIFGSQIALLKHLNVVGTLRKDQIENLFYNVAKLNFPSLYDTYSFEQYLHYLKAFNLISTTDNQTFVITDEGKLFLEWMVHVGAIEIKPF